MIWHPLLIAVTVADLLGFLLLATAAKTAFQIVLGWAPESAKREQILLERRAEGASLSARFGLVLFGLATALLVIGITNVLPEIVPGAMCGTGVLQATDGLWGQALLYRFLVCFIMVVWIAFEKLNLSRPEAPLTKVNARLLLLAVPVFSLAAITTFRGIMRIDSHRPVDCCTVVYDQFASLAAARQTAGIPDTLWVAAFWVLTALVLACGFRLLKTESAAAGKRTASIALLCLFWVPIAAITLVRVYAAYYYQVLEHHCPWCLFLPEHKLVGVPLFGALAVVALEGPLSYLTARIAVRYPDLFQTAMIRSRLAGLRLVLATAAYAAMVAVPAVSWRLLYRVWLG